MSSTLTITLPVSRGDLVNEIENELSPYMRIQTEKPPRTGGMVSFGGIPEIKMVIEVVGQGVLLMSSLATATSVGTDAVNKLLDLIDRIKQRGQGEGLKVKGPGGETKSFRDVDEGWLRQQVH